MKLKDRIISFIAQSRGVVVLRSEFIALGASDSQVSRVLNRLIAQGFIQRVSQGAYVKTRLNQFTGTFTPAAPLEVVAKELFAKLNIEIVPPPAVLDYNAGRTTQVPAGGIVVVKGRRISRKISVGGRSIRYA